ncbi:RagB/SusD family nutrient uptake outer membrane protein [Compostibacter hankyongensis]|uniref:RagB/SusD family nutrient uptake outer membrane protein n=1 Tax=Compostibacter hankyongensis TaxID=1007089 RepID=A0ABP8G229_9BACT
MKRILYFFILLSVALAGCEKSGFLKESPTDRFVEGNFYSSPSDAQAAVDAVYNQLYSIYDRNMILLNDLPADDEKNGLGMPNQYLQDLEFLKYTTENTFIQSMWGSNYSGIGRANSAINNINKMSFDTTLKARLIGEASFLRALYYFNLVRFFGDVPLILDLKTLKDAIIPRTSTDSVYDQIIKDLQFAEDNLPVNYDSKNLGRATSGAAKILLGEVYLTRHDFQQAADKLAEVVKHEEEYGYGLNNDFADNWKIPTENGKESVFSVQHLPPPGHAIGLMTLEGPKYSVPGGGIPGIPNTNEADIPTMDLYTRYIDGDTRKDVTFKIEYLSPANGQIYKSSIPLFGKYWEEGLTKTGNCDINMQVIRYADALLMYAESLNETGNTADAVKILNRVRERAFHDTEHDYADLTQSQFRTKIYLERRLEFANEGKRWFDLVRTGRLLEVMKAHGTLEAKLAESNKTTITQNARAYQSLYPIPQRELDLNKLLTQNQGW